MAMASAGGDPSLEVMKRHPRLAIRHWWRSVTASEPAALWHEDETRCPIGEGRFVEGASDHVQA